MNKLIRLEVNICFFEDLAKPFYTDEATAPTLILSIKSSSDKRLLPFKFGLILDQGVESKEDGETRFTTNYPYGSFWALEVLANFT